MPSFVNMAVASSPSQLRILSKSAEGFHYKLFANLNSFTFRSMHSNVLHGVVSLTRNIKPFNFNVDKKNGNILCLDIRVSQNDGKIRIKNVWFENQKQSRRNTNWRTKLYIENLQAFYTRALSSAHPVGNTVGNVLKNKINVWNQIFMLNLTTKQIYTDKKWTLYIFI